MSRLVRFHKIGDADVLNVEDVEVEQPGPGEVRIRTRALGLNRAEVMFRTGQYTVDPVFPSRIGYEAAGEVDAVGPGVTTVAVGDSVSVVPAFAMTDYGVHGELIVAPARAVVKHPEHLSWEQAAATWMQFITAYGGLIDLADLSRGDFVLIPAASSSVGMAAIQVARMVGAHPIALTRSSAKRQQLSDAGATAVIATGEEDVVQRVNELTDGKGARVVFDPVGGPGFADLTSAATSHAMLIVYGALVSAPLQVPVMDVLGKHLTIRGFELFEITTDDQRLAKAVEFVCSGLESGALAPVVDKVFSLDDIAEAHRYLEQGGQVGKVVVTV